LTEWFARPVLHVSSVNAALRFYVDRLGFRVPWRVEDQDGDIDVAQPTRCFNYPNEPREDPEGLRRTS
jgi:catechol 2,3-dioxygenase-like lactoylglutathione lyase family enzyme